MSPADGSGADHRAPQPEGPSVGSSGPDVATRGCAAGLLAPHPGAVLAVVQPGIGTTVQDAGRRGHRHHGLPVAGWLDGPLARAALALLGQPGDAAVLELRGAGTVLAVRRGPVQMALAGRIGAQVLGAEGARRPLPAWQTATLQTGEQLQLGPAETGCAYLAVASGLALPPAFGSRSSDWRAGLAGVLGRPLQPGDELPCGIPASAEPATPTTAATAATPATASAPTAAAHEWQCAEPWAASDGPIRVLPGPQDDHFSPEAIARFYGEAWQATTAQDRMGLRFEGPPLAHRTPAAADIVSDGVAPGAIQVPANGQPIVLLADGQTVGGYPKIATVIQADLPRLAHLRPGTRVRFAAVDRAEARRAAQQEAERWQRWLAGRRPARPPGGIDEAALYAANLISGIIDARG